MLINFSQFNVGADMEFQMALSAIEENDVEGMIIDLRDNPGGLLDEAVRILGHFVEAQQDLVTINYVDYSQVLLSRGDASYHDFPTVILINEGSASASEIVAGALRDYELATLVGETSYGKGTVQEINYFIDNSSLKLTIAEWLTPLRESIQNGGIEPDILVTDDPETEKDEQLDRAISALQSIMR